MTVPWMLKSSPLSGSGPGAGSRWQGVVKSPQPTGPLHYGALALLVTWIHEQSLLVEQQMLPIRGLRESDRHTTTRAITRNAIRPSEMRQLTAIGRRTSDPQNRFGYVVGRPSAGAALVDVQDINIADHVYVVPVAPPPGRPSCCPALSGCGGARLDRSRPLWQMWFLPGWPDGRVGLYMRPANQSSNSSNSPSRRVAGANTASSKA